MVRYTLLPEHDVFVMVAAIPLYETDHPVNTVAQESAAASVILADPFIVRLTVTTVLT